MEPILTYIAGMIHETEPFFVNIQQ